MTDSRDTQKIKSGVDQRAIRGAPFLSINSMMQSTLEGRNRSAFRRRQANVLLIYAAILMFLLGLNFGISLDASTSSILLGLTFPSAGFLHWTSEGQLVLSSSLFLAGCGMFVAALTIWFATGNVLVPIAAWIGLSVIASFPSAVGLNPIPATGVLPWMIGPALLLVVMMFWLRWKPVKVARSGIQTINHEMATQGLASLEMTASDSARVRLLLDRALQPNEEFNGFEWRDQFQTAAVRYQVNFLGYALAMTKQNHAPAAAAYFDAAQTRLLRKIGDHKLWSYWQLENAWGNLKLDPDPVPHQNIMYSGFTLLQMALGGGKTLELTKDKKPWRNYQMDDIAGALDRQYSASNYGLLECEPNWIYPLCNLISMAGVKASDARLGTSRWERLAEPFLASLDREATRSNGSFIAFRSSLTGFAPPAPGGIVMQAFPCLFLNALAPERAQEHWHRVQKRLQSGSWKRQFWPIDTGNYGFSRASSYAATAAAAVEMGDYQIAEECFRRLEIECPTQDIGGATHRSSASLWAHALETFARSNRPNGLRDLVAMAPARSGPYLSSAPYSALNILRASADEEKLDLVLLPQTDGRQVSLEIGGLQANRDYVTNQSGRRFVAANETGFAQLSLCMSGRTHFSIRPAF